jgi:flagellar hook-length control protein FliK
MHGSAKSRPVYEKLDTAYVNLAALLRYLQQHNFAGRVHVELDEYEADVILSAQGEIDVRETDRAMGREARGEAALQRLIVRAMAAGGLISVYEDAEEEVERSNQPSTTSETGAAQEASARVEDVEDSSPEEEEEVDWQALLRLSGELIGAVERASLGVGADFFTAFHLARLEAADDFSFLDPSAGRFEYAYSVVRLHAEPSARAFTSGIGTCLHLTVEKLAAGERGGSVRERVALELAVLARRRQAELKLFGLTPQLERIAGTRVL